MKKIHLAATYYFINILRLSAISGKICGYLSKISIAMVK